MSIAEQDAQIINPEIPELANVKESKTAVFGPLTCDHSPVPIAGLVALSKVESFRQRF